MAIFKIDVEYFTLHFDTLKINALIHFTFCF